MLRQLDLRGFDGDLRSRLPRPTSGAGLPVAEVNAILAAVAERGDAAVRELTERFDGAVIDDLSVTPDACAAALASLPATLTSALEEARDRIEAYHQAQAGHGAPVVHESGGITVRELRRPVDRAGLYVPAAAAPLVSTVLMTAVPARVAGVGEVVLCAAPDRQGRIAPGILAAAALAGVDEVYRVGGVQAVAAMAYGTETIRAVDVIVGPGSARVAQAKREVASRGVVGVPSSFAGPSEVVVVADDSTPVGYAAVDLVVQLEHGPDSVAWLITWSDAAAGRIVEAVKELVVSAPRRDVIEANLEENAFVALVEGPEQAMAVANVIAPEHLQLMVADPEALLSRVRHAGAVFCGPFAPASVGDYLAGPSHVLPTYGSARFASALGVDDFQKRSHVVSLDQAALARVGPHVVALAEAEGLAAHAESIRVRTS